MIRSKLNALLELYNQGTEFDAAGGSAQVDGDIGLSSPLSDNTWTVLANTEKGETPLSYAHQTDTTMASSSLPGKRARTVEVHIFWVHAPHIALFTLDIHSGGSKHQQ